MLPYTINGCSPAAHKARPSVSDSPSVSVPPLNHKPDNYNSRPTHVYLAAARGGGGVGRVYRRAALVLPAAQPTLCITCMDGVWCPGFVRQTVVGDPGRELGWRDVARGLRDDVAHADCVDAPYIVVMVAWPCGVCFRLLGACVLLVTVPEKLSHTDEDCRRRLVIGTVGFCRLQ